MKPRRPILRLRNAPSAGERRTNAHNAYLSEGDGDSYPSRRPNPVKQGISFDSYPSQANEAGTDTDRTKPLETRDWDGGTDTNPSFSGNGPRRNVASVAISRCLSGNGKEGPADRPVDPGPNPGERLGDAYRRATDGE